ncbi:unnamed protein product [Rodentolepis nana]|uniref:MARVEL domain-containing protein n=1 Tax=Rodentolepis nana TaxID=102285 RepID=A0A0R3T840_RODNA|nr:unnamed protein product [Rodentolepis nana]
MIHAGVKYVVAIIAIIIFTCLAVSLDVNVCGPIFSIRCRNINDSYIQMTGLIATALILFGVAAILSILALMKSLRWIVILEMLVILAGAILMFTALLILYRNTFYWASLMGGVAMSLAFETAAFLLIEMMT